VENFQAKQDSLASPDAMAERVLADATRTFAATDRAALEACVREAVADLWVEGIRVKTFVPVLAMRRVREMVEAREGRATAGA
jgi:hypothetical protein